MQSLFTITQGNLSIKSTGHLNDNKRTTISKNPVTMIVERNGKEAQPQLQFTPNTYT
jgi:hypothetical protein